MGKRVYASRTVAKKRSKKSRSNILLVRPTGTELKFVDYTLTSTLCSTTANIYTLNFLAQGSDVYNRIGRKINVKSVLIKGRFIPSGNAIINDLVRLIVVYDRQGYDAGAGIAIADLIKNVDSAGLTSSTVYDMRNLDNDLRFKTLMDKSFSFPQTAATFNSGVHTDATQKTCVHQYMKCNAEVSFKSGTNIPDTGAIYLMVLGQQVAALAPSTFQWTSRVRFTDN